MASESRRRASKNLTRRERRSGVARSYTVPTHATVGPRRSYMAEPTPMDYSTEYSYIRKDLFRILLWATVLIVAMVVLAFLPIF
jgi:hypothetical protein